MIFNKIYKLLNKVYIGFIRVYCIYLGFKSSL